MRRPKRCLEYDSTPNFRHQIYKLVFCQFVCLQAIRKLGRDKNKKIMTVKKCVACGCNIVSLLNTADSSSLVFKKKKRKKQCSWLKSLLSEGRDGLSKMQL